MHGTHHAESASWRRGAKPRLVPGAHVIDLFLLRFDDALRKREYLGTLGALQGDLRHLYRTFVVRDHLHNKVLVNVLAHPADAKALAGRHRATRQCIPNTE